VQGRRLISARVPIPGLTFRLRPIDLWLAGLLSTALAVATSLATAGWDLGNLWAVLGLASVAILAERNRVRLSDHIEISICLLPTLLAGVLFGPLASMLVWGVSMLGGFSRSEPSPYMRLGIYSSSRSIAGAVTGAVAYRIAHGQIDQAFFASMAAAGVGAIVAQTLDVLFASCTLRLRGSGAAFDVLRTLGPLVLAAVPLYMPMVAVLAVAYTEISPWTLVLFFVPALAAQRLFAMYQYQRRLAEDLATANVRLERANLSFATLLVATLEAKDRYTAGHSAAVAIYAQDIAARLGLTEEEQRLTHVCGLVHDIGKVGLPPGLLEKPGALTLQERRVMETHSEIGERIFAKVDDYAEIAKIVRHHHERWDGQGYPDGLSAEEIPLIARIIAAADAYNAMTSDRPYRDAMPSRVARLRLAQGVESQFDTTVVAAFEAILAGATEEYRLATRDDFTLDEQDRYTGASEDVEPVAAAGVA
jgi:putative nucleotidyltransferase with HDIG domain